MTRTLTSRQEAEELRAAEQGQQALELASMGGGGVELQGKSASIRSFSDSIQSSNACSLSSCIALCSSSCSLCSSSLSRISLSGSCHQLSICKNERKRESDEPDAPLLRDGDEAPREGDVVIGEKERKPGNHQTSDGLKHSQRVKRYITRAGLHQRQATGVHVSRRSATPSAPTPTLRP
jgi:hypothetical protein